jgi:hypothetical protein
MKEDRMKTSLWLVCWLGASLVLAEGELPAVNALLAGASKEDERLFESWPTVEQVCEQAILLLPAVVREGHNWAGRQKAAALLPRIRAGRNTHEANYVISEIRQDPNNSDRYTDLRGTDGIRDLDGFFVWAEWDLSRLLFDADEVDSATAERQMAEFRMRVRDLVIQNYFGLRESRRRLAHGTYVEKQDRLTVQTIAETQQAALDSLTGGFFSGCLKQSRSVSNTEKK